MKINHHLMKSHPTHHNQAWAVDFAMLDYDHKPFVMLVVDIHTRLLLSATVTLAIAADVTATLERLGHRFGLPEEVWIDRGLHLPVLQTWAEPHGISIACGPSLRIRAVTELRLHDLCAFLRDKRFPTLMELGHDIERWRQCYCAAAQPIPDVKQ